MNNRLKSRLLPVLLIGASLACLTCVAQTSNPPPIDPNPANVLTKAQEWLTSYDTNSLTFQGSGVAVSIWNGPKYQSGLNIADTFGLNADLFKGSAPNSASLSLDAMVDIVGIGGAISGFQGGLGVSKTLWDVKLAGYLDVGYDNARNQVFLDPCFEINKAFNRYMSTGLKVGFPIYRHRSSALQVPTVWWKAFTVNI